MKRHRQIPSEAAVDSAEAPTDDSNESDDSAEAPTDDSPDDPEFKAVEEVEVKIERPPRNEFRRRRGGF